MATRILFLASLAAVLALSVVATPASAQNASSPPPPPNFAAGDLVDVEFTGGWYPATVLSVIAGRWEIAYDGYGADWHQLVGPDRIRARSTPPAATNATTPPASATTPPASVPPPPGRAIAHLRRVGSGTHVLVEWHGTWYRARILRVLDDTDARIHYVGYDQSSDEDVPLDRVRAPDKA